MLYDASPTPGQVSTAMATLRDLGIAKVVIEFSGGNDEGGPDSTEYLNADGTAVDGVESSSAHSRRKWDSETATYGPEEWVVSEYKDVDGKPLRRVPGHPQPDSSGGGLPGA